MESDGLWTGVVLNKGATGKQDGRPRATILCS